MDGTKPAWEASLPIWMSNLFLQMARLQAGRAVDPVSCFTVLAAIGSRYMARPSESKQKTSSGSCNKAERKFGVRNTLPKKVRPSKNIVLAERLYFFDKIILETGILLKIDLNFNKN